MSFNLFGIGFFILLLSGCVNGSGKVDYYGIESKNFMSSSAQLWGRAWIAPVQWDDTASKYPECDDLVESNLSSACIQELNILQRNLIYPKEDREEFKSAIGEQKKEIKTALVAIKMKAWAMEENAYCQLTVKFGERDSISMSNFANHIEVYGNQNWMLSGRNISYLVLPLPIEKRKITMQLQREIIGKCEVSIAINILGFYALAQ